MEESLWQHTLSRTSLAAAEEIMLLMIAEPVRRGGETFGGTGNLAIVFTSRSRDSVSPVSHCRRKQRREIVGLAYRKSTFANEISEIRR